MTILGLGIGIGLALGALISVAVTAFRNRGLCMCSGWPHMSRCPRSRQARAKARRS